jgi:nucleoside-diphosphate-sugar epimerase
MTDVNKSIFITGSSGFVGKNIIHYLSNYNFTIYNRASKIVINEDVILNLAGKAHDLKKISNSTSYYEANTEFTKNVFDSFLNSDAKVFITISSVKAVADELTIDLTEDYTPNPITHYGKSKLLAEQYILSKEIPINKRVYILRPCMIHGPGNKGNLNLLYKIVKKGFPWPLAAFDNKRSFCSVENLCFIIKELIENESIPSGIYNIADNESLSTNELVKLIAKSEGKIAKCWSIPKFIVIILARIGDKLNLPINSEKLSKLTTSYVVSNEKIKKAINKELPINSKSGLLKTFNTFT